MIMLAVTTRIVVMTPIVNFGFERFLGDVEGEVGVSGLISGEVVLSGLAVGVDCLSMQYLLDE